MSVRLTQMLTALAVTLFVASCSSHVQSGTEGAVTMKVTSKAFVENQPIPDKYTCHGDDVSPDLQWTGAPNGTKSFALTCVDPDAPGGTFTHWVIYDIPPTAAAFSENVPKTETLDDGSKQGKNSFGNIGYNGPCPPAGNPHRYCFKVYALDTNFNLNAGVEKSDLLDAMNGHVLAQGQLMGTYGVSGN